MRFLQSASPASSSTAPRSAVLQRCSCGGKHNDGECADCKRKRVQRSAAGPAPMTAPGSVHSVLAGPGRPLETSVQSSMQSRLGHDFSQVRIHDDSCAARSAADVHAHAYTVGNHVVFESGAYNPHTSAGQQLLAHELTHVRQQAGALPASRIEVVSADHPSEREAESAAVSATRHGYALQRYAHQDCTEDDLKKYVWPSDWEARQMTNAAIGAVTASPVTTRTEDLFEKYFMTRTPDTATIAKEFRTVKKAFADNSYTYECEDDCSGTTIGYSGTGWDIHLCMNHLSGKSAACVGRTILHEFTHKYGWLDDEAYCKSGCSFSRCPASLSTSDALDNADSFACFAYELYTGP